MSEWVISVPVWFYTTRKDGSTLEPYEGYLPVTNIRQANREMLETLSNPGTRRAPPPLAGPPLVPPARPPPGPRMMGPRHPLEAESLDHLNYAQMYMDQKAMEIDRN